MIKHWLGGIAGILIGILLVGCAHRQPLRVMEPVSQAGYVYWVGEDGRVLLIVVNNVAYQEAIKRICKSPCAIEPVGEAYVVEELK